MGKLCRIAVAGAIGGAEWQRREAEDLAFEAFGQCLGDRRVDEFADVAIQRGDFAHQRRGDIGVFF
jgi:hypothetical protein